MLFIKLLLLLYEEILLLLFVVELLEGLTFLGDFEGKLLFYDVGVGV